MARTIIPHSVKRPVKLPAIFRHTPDQELSLKLIPHGHLQAIVDGRGTEEEFLTVAFRVMVGGSLTAFADEAGEKALEGVYVDALKALVSVGERYERLSKFGCNGDELKSLKDAINLTDDLQEVTTRRQQAEMYKQVMGFVGGFAFTMKNLRTLLGKMQ